MSDGLDAAPGTSSSSAAASKATSPELLKCAESESTEVVEGLKAGESTTTLRQVYGMLCWLLADSGHKQIWRQDPGQACRLATQQCPHLQGASVTCLLSQMNSICHRRTQILEEHEGSAAEVPRETRVFPGGPLFVIVDYAMTEEDRPQCAAVMALLRMNATGHPPPQQQDQGCGPVRHRPADKARGTPYGRKALEERVRRLTPAEIQQMRSEMAIRREIALRDARLLADWTAMKRRELELKEAKIREFIRAQEDGTLASLVEFEKYLKRLHDGL
ncbi:hypothetical protein GGF46_005457 [Coemansia sp. RSA 552]|nr:hypothetical protein GGF46_005457 [Coemansia sp. RSA 552]